MGSGRCRSLLPALLLLLLVLVLLVLPSAWGACGPLPNISHAEPTEDMKDKQSFSEGSTVRYVCATGYTKRPFLSDTVQCLTNSQWSHLPEFCGQYHGEVHLSPGFENTTDQLPTSTCLDNLKWSEVPELCRRKSCGIPASPEHGKVITDDHLLGAKATVVCDRGYVLEGGSPSIFCTLRGNEVVWSQLPACQAVSCPPPPAIPHGQHDGNSTEKFLYDSVATYTCDPGLELVGNKSLRCTTENGVLGVWNGAAPECRVSTAAETNQTESSKGNPYWLASILIPSCIVPPVALGILAGIIMRRKDSEKHSYNMNLQKHKVREGCTDVPEEAARAMEFLFLPHNELPRVSHLQEAAARCPGPSHGAHAPRLRRLRALAEHQQTTHLLGPQHCSPAKAVDVQRGHGAGEAGPEWSEVEQPVDHKSPRGPVCSPCTDQLHLSLVHSDEWSSPVVCPLAAEGTPAHLVPQHTPSCHLCPVCAVPTHTHLCQPQHQAPDGDCPQAPTFVFAELTTTPQESYSVGTELRYRCRPGYVRNGNQAPVVTCLPNSTWSEQPDFCIGKSCGQPDIPNGRFYTSTNLLVGATITFTCNIGYRLVGPPTAQCVFKNGEVYWNNIPICEIIACPPPPEIKNGQLLGGEGEFTFGMAASYSCNNGFSLIGDGTIYCTIGPNYKGTWNGPAPECKMVSCENPDVENGKGCLALALSTHIEIQ
ncbi:complement receptor type 1-like [Chiroxiphia lanceolata]|uniref:complement receptor type 1-like n=1 Tax=Chiroxiphia lanceolata TaxID=296741 RepID=UPI0013CF2ABA|nr:complement receptor type 1-like [Chiroxiphia lanceolata]